MTAPMGPVTNAPDMAASTDPSWVFDDNTEIA